MSIEKITKNVLRHEPIPYTIIYNKSMRSIRNTGAAGVWGYLATMPEGWIINKKELQNHFECGRDHIQTCLNFLRKIGAIVVYPTKDKEGKILYWNTILKREFFPPTDKKINNVVESATEEFPTHMVNNFPENHTTENPYCGQETVSTLRENHNTGNPTSGFSAPINKIYIRNKYNKKYVCDRSYQDTPREEFIEPEKQHTQDLEIYEPIKIPEICLIADEPSTQLTTIPQTIVKGEFVSETRVVKNDSPFGVIDVEQLKQTCLKDKRCNETFDEKFKDFDLTLEELHTACFMYYALKQQYVSPQRFHNWINKEQISNYKKKSAVKTPGTSLNPDDLELLQNYAYQQKNAHLGFILSETQMARAEQLQRGVKAQPAPRYATSSSRVNSPMRLSGLLQKYSNNRI